MIMPVFKMWALEHDQRIAKPTTSYNSDASHQISSSNMRASCQESMKELNCRALETRESCVALWPENLQIAREVASAEQIQ